MQHGIGRITIRIRDASFLRTVRGDTYPIAHTCDFTADFAEYENYEVFHRIFHSVMTQPHSDVHQSFGVV